MIDRDALMARAREQLPDVIALRRALHRRPELGNHMPETRARVLEALAPLDLEIELSEATSGLVATLRGARPGPCILLRADMDALPMPEDTGLDYGSEIEGRMHACGHDAHTAMLVGAARLLAGEREQLPGEVKLFFQTGEEGHFGARLALEEGLLERGRSPDAAFALHADSRLAVGRVASRPGALLASVNDWSVRVKGRGGHAAIPHTVVDPIQAACEIVTSLQTMVTRRVSAFDPVVLTTTKIHAGTAGNVIPETAYLVGTMRAMSETSRLAAEEGIHRVAYGVGQAHGVEVEVEIENGYPVTVNDARMTGAARAIANDLLGERAFIELRSPVMGGEDFSYILERWPGTMLFIGLRPRDVEDADPVHSNRMQIDEDGMAVGVALHVAVAKRFLGAGGIESLG
jgi:hippurate hydrolase